ncbi:ACP S-malonyltransferase [Inmirania thermothiophila]|uniref:Malonyl CoA-acyl carrier protein transacylase n=1 Tax=Inmirania thermothiophila TaxID=1750597 RepID=A0A3N1Y1C2_9GAMM|nr:ACP S-malonyltransferase [Inmirania thermothiophila]ROR32633.1 [acyl-carrier-protein] S-malonyltransferase [Inmirania thermothiophila]
MGLAFLFPGQGSQAVGMLGGLAAAHREVRETFDEASEALGLDLWRLVSEGPEAELNRTVNTQPAMLAAGVAVWRVWLAQGGPRPAWMAGHSLGEYTALVCAGALDLADAVGLVAERGRLMQEAVPEGEGAMAAILGLEAEAVAEICRRAARDQVVAPANLNAPDQVVVAGQREAVERAVAAAREAGARRAVTLPVSVPSHCALMRPAAEALAARLAEVEIRPPAIPVVHNADVCVHGEPQAIREALARQLYSPVRWVETVQRLVREGVDMAVECGPGKVLAGLVRRIERGLPVHPIGEPAGLEAALAAVRG